jgi:hypothetical protein
MIAIPNKAILEFKENVLDENCYGEFFMILNMLIKIYPF